jgi:hypothetical protein
VQQPSGSGASAPGASGGKGGNGSQPWQERLWRPQLLEMPPQTTTMSDSQFRFNVPPRKPVATAPPAQPGKPPAATPTRRFECRLDGAGWSDCQSPYKLTGLTPGSHSFAVRVFNHEERVGEAVGFEWRQTVEVAAPPQQASEVAVPFEPKQFTVVALQNPENLYPGLAPTPIPVRVANPNDVAIEVTEIAAAIVEPPADCGAENFELTPAGVSPEDPVLVPANGSVELPAAGLAAPTIKMLDLPVEQDACRGAEIPLVFSGEAHG